MTRGLRTNGQFKLRRAQLALSTYNTPANPEEVRQATVKH